MPVFVDTSAFYAVLDASDAHHSAAGRIWRGLVEHRSDMVSSNYVLVESFALLQRHLGHEAARAFQTDMLPVVDVQWVDESMHAAGVAALLTAARRQLSLVDCVSFELMRRSGLREAFAFDADFGEQGFTCLA